MKRFFALLATLFALALLFGGCARPDHRRNDEGGRLWSLAEVIEEGAEEGAGVSAQDTCEDCCLPYVCTIFCCNQPGGGGGGDTGGGGQYPGDFCSNRTPIGCWYTAPNGIGCIRKQNCS